jgi:hypothetical protein
LVKPARGNLLQAVDQRFAARLPATAFQSFQQRQEGFDGNTVDFTLYLLYLIDI